METRALTEVAGDPVLTRGVHARSPGCAGGLDGHNVADSEADQSIAYEFLSTLCDYTLKLHRGAGVTGPGPAPTVLVPKLLPVLAPELGAFQHDRRDGLPDGRAASQQGEPFLVVLAPKPDAGSNAIVEQLSFVKKRGDGLEHLDRARFGAAEPDKRQASHPTVRIRAQNAWQRHHRSMGPFVLSSVGGMTAEQPLTEPNQRIPLR